MSNFHASKSKVNSRAFMMKLGDLPNMVDTVFDGDHMRPGWVHRPPRTVVVALTLLRYSVHRNIPRIVKSSGFCEIGPMPACFSEQGGSHRRGGASAPQTSGESK
jgi:hypothetical protein